MGDWRTARVLDHGFVHLRDSMPALDDKATRGDVYGIGDARVVEAARVSMAHLPIEVIRELGLDLEPGERTEAHDKKTLKYMFDHAHTSPFEKVRFEFVAKMPIFVARQWIRHRMASVNEQSARYSKLPCEFYVPELDRMQAQSTANKQGSAELLPPSMAAAMRASIHKASRSAYATYEELLANGLTRELARMVLPTNFYTQWYWTVDLHNLMGFCRQRCDSHAQWEIRVYANTMLEMARHVAPYAVGLFCEKHGFGAGAGR
jgi:thymidylate synthase (FAD)